MWGPFAPTVLSTVHFLFDLLLAPVVLDASFLSSRTSPVFFSMSWELVMACFRFQGGAARYLLVNCTRYIILTPCLYSRSSQSVGNTLHSNLGNHQFLNQKPVCHFLSIMCIFMFHGNISFFKNVFITSYWCSLTWQFFPLFQCKCLKFIYL